MKVEGNLHLLGFSFLPPSRNDRFISERLSQSVVSVTNCPGSSVQVSGEGGSARPARSRVRELLGPLMGGSRYLYIGNSYLHRIVFDTEAIVHSRPGDRAHKKAERKIALLEDRLDERKLNLSRAAADAARDNGKRMGDILAVNAQRLVQAQALKTRLGDPLSSQIRLKGLIRRYKSFSDDIHRRRPPTPGTSTPAVTPK